MDNSESQHFANYKTDWLGCAILTAKVAATAMQSSPIPAIGSVASVFVVFLELIQNIKKNRDDLKELVQFISSIIQTIQEATADYEGSDLSRFSGVCAELEEYLSSLIVCLKREPKATGFKKLLRTNQVHERILSYRQHVENLRANLTLHASIHSRLHQNSMCQILSVLDANVRDLQSGVASIRETQTVSLESQVYARKVRVLLEGDIMLQGCIRQHEKPYPRPQRKRKHPVQLVQVLDYVADLGAPQSSKIVRTYLHQSSPRKAWEEWRSQCELYMQLKHPNVLQIYGVCDSPTFQAIVFHGGDTETIASLLGRLDGVDRIIMELTLVRQYETADRYLQERGLRSDLLSSDLVVGSQHRLVLTKIQSITSYRHLDLQYLQSLKRSISKVSIPSYYRLLHMLHRMQATSSGWTGQNYPLGCLVSSSGVVAFYEFCTPTQLMLSSFDVSHKSGSYKPIPLSTHSAADTTILRFSRGTKRFRLRCVLPETILENFCFSAFSEVEQWIDRFDEDDLISITTGFEWMLRVQFLVGTEMEDVPDDFYIVVHHPSLHTTQHPAFIPPLVFDISWDAQGQNLLTPTESEAFGIYIEATLQSTKKIQWAKHRCEALLDLHRKCNLGGADTPVADALGYPLLHIVTPQIAVPSFRCPACLRKGYLDGTHSSDDYHSKFWEPRSISKRRRRTSPLHPESLTDSDGLAPALVKSSPSTLAVKQIDYPHPDAVVDSNDVEKDHTSHSGFFSNALVSPASTSESPILSTSRTEGLLIMVIVFGFILLPLALAIYLR